MQILINGKILFRKITGIERYARETLHEIDKKTSLYEFKIAIPEGCNEKLIPTYKNLEIVKIKGFKNSFLWDQISLPLYARRTNGVVACFDFATSILFPGISTIHDMSFKANREFFANSINKKVVRCKLDWYCMSAVRSKYPIFTVTNYQKQEINKFYNIDDHKIIVAGNAWQHFTNIMEDDSVFTEYDIPTDNYYFSLSSNTDNKNFKWVYDAAKNNKNSEFVIVGGKTSISPNDLNSEKNIKYLGYQSDERVKSLYRHCKAFIFPSYYEGFGIPPMEALSVGAKIIISNTSCLPEVYGKAAYYIDPDNANINLEELIQVNTVADSETVLKKYSWENTAQIWISVLRQIANKDRIY